MRDAENRAAAGIVGPILHDMLNLLTAVATIAEAASRQVPEGSPAQRTIAELQELVARGMEMPSGLLEEIERHHGPQLADLTGLVESAFAVAHGAAEGVELELRLLDEPLWVVVGAAAVERILVNLVLNARDATPRGGRVSVTVDRDQLNGRDAAALEVADEGRGMDEQTLARALQPYFTTRPGVGHGLGLPTVQALASEAGGTVTIDSQPGRGTKVRVRFPLLRPPSPRSRFRRDAGTRLGYG